MARQKMSETAAVFLSVLIVMAIGGAVFGGAYLLSKHTPPTQVADTHSGPPTKQTVSLMPSPPATALKNEERGPPEAPTR
jgi:hypothetical protein